MKVLRPELAHALGPERFLREIATTANLHHPHILAVVRLGADFGTPPAPSSTTSCRLSKANRCATG